MSRRPSHLPHADLCLYSRCPHADRIITAPQRLSAVRLSSGLMHADCHHGHLGRVRVLLAPREGALPYTTLCESCREWVDGIFHVTFDGRRLCVTCAARSGDPTAIISLTRQGRWCPATHQPLAAPPPPPPPPPPAAPSHSLMSLLDDL